MTASASFTSYKKVVNVDNGERSSGATSEQLRRPALTCWKPPAMSKPVAWWSRSIRPVAAARAERGALQTAADRRQKAGSTAAPPSRSVSLTQLHEGDEQRRPATGW